MKFFTKVAISAISIGFTVFAGIWGGFEEIDKRMDDKVSKGRKEVLEIVYNLKDDEASLHKAQDEKFTVQMVAVNTNMLELKKDVRTILLITRKQQAFIENKGKSYYTVRETENKGNHL